MKLRHICAGVLAGAVICSSLTGCTLKTHTAESGAQSSAAQEAESSAAAAVSAGKAMAESASELMSAAAGTEVSGADIEKSARGASPFHIGLFVLKLR